ncbi:MAG: hypothetical protein M3Y32_11780, partial [Pseudomonadota bacterium]|nr:hypothetical protein [Pseudomonadota bacterium]
MKAIRYWRHGARAKVVAALIGLGTLACGPASAQARNEPNGFTWGELALLPPFCKDTQGTVYG